MVDKIRLLRSPAGSIAAQMLPLWTPAEQGYREAYLNAKLARKWMDPAAHPWAALDFAGVEFGGIDACQQAIAYYRQVNSKRSASSLCVS